MPAYTPHYWTEYRTPNGVPFFHRRIGGYQLVVIRDSYDMTWGWAVEENKYAMMDVAGTAFMNKRRRKGTLREAISAALTNVARKLKVRLVQ